MTPRSKKSRCVGQVHTKDGTFFCPDKAVAEATWEGSPFGPDAPVCAIHAAQVQEAHDADPKNYPGLEIVSTTKEAK